MYVLIGVALINIRVAKKNQVRNVVGGIDALLKKRYDLIPNLVAAVKNYMKHEREILTNITEMRARAVGDCLANRIFRMKPDRYRGDDLVTGLLGKTETAFSEIHSEYKTSRSSKSGTHTTWRTVFKGLFFIAGFNKSFKGETYVLPEVAQKVFGKILGNLFQPWNRGRGQLVKMEDPTFEMNFVVYGDDQIEARYVLSTSLMKRITDYKKKRKKTSTFRLSIT